MRLLAVTAGDAAQGRITEADQLVGAISVDGTMGFVIFRTAMTLWAWTRSGWGLGAATHRFSKLEPSPSAWA